MQQSSSLDFKLVQRVCLLQQALDQALSSLDELQAQVQHKQWVEIQLADTEKYANVQQKAISHLKQQLEQYTAVQNRLLRVMGYRLNELIDKQQKEFDALSIQFQQSNIELQTYLQYIGWRQQSAYVSEDDPEAYRTALEAEVMVARSMVVHVSQHLNTAQEYLDSLKENLGSHHLDVGQIIKTIQGMMADLQAFRYPELEELLDSTAEEEPASSEVTAILDPEDVMDSVGEDQAEEDEVLYATLRRQSLRLLELESTLREHLEHETHLRQRCQTIAAERDHYKRELQKLRKTRAATDQQPKKSLSQPAVDEFSSSPQSAQRSHRRLKPSQPIKPLQVRDDIL